MTCRHRWGRAARTSLWAHLDGHPAAHALHLDRSSIFRSDSAYITVIVWFLRQLPRWCGTLLLKPRGRVNSNIGISVVQKLDCQFLQLWTCVQPCGRSINVAIERVIGPALRSRSSHTWRFFSIVAIRARNHRTPPVNPIHSKHRLSPHFHNAQLAQLLRT